MLRKRELPFKLSHCIQIEQYTQIRKYLPDEAQISALMYDKND